jgi:hypothetical protein
MYICRNFKAVNQRLHSKPLKIKKQYTMSNVKIKGNLQRWHRIQPKTEPAGCWFQIQRQLYLICAVCGARWGFLEDMFKIWRTAADSSRLDQSFQIRTSHY